MTDLKRAAQVEHCWETPDGQVQCGFKEKRDASAAPRT